MLIKLLSNGPDYERALRRRRLMSFGLLAVGLTGVVCYFLLIDSKDILPDFAQGFYLGRASGICLGSVILLVRIQVLLANPEARKRARIKEQDEREKAIINQSFQFAGMFTFFAAAASLFVLVAASMEAALAVLGVVAVYAVVWLLSSLCLSKTL